MQTQLETTIIGSVGTSQAFWVTPQGENWISHFNLRSPFLLKAGHTHSAPITDIIICLRSEHTTFTVASQSAERILEQWKVEEWRIKMGNKADFYITK